MRRLIITYILFFKENPKPKKKNMAFFPE